MKTTILSITIALILSSCGSSSKETEQTAAQQTSADTTGLSEYQNWKAQKEQLQELDMNGITALPQEENNITPVYESPKPATKVIYRDRPAKAPRVVRRTEPTVRYEEPVVYTPTPKPTGRSREAVSRNDGGVTGETGNDESIGTGTSDAPVASTPVPAKKEGWSKAAKGTAIGAGSGAVLGAIISKNKAKGAIIGGVIGGVGGYVLGRSKDKKDGRYLVSNN